MYGSYQPYGQPSDYVGFPGAAPGTNAPGMQQQDAHQGTRPGGFPPNFQPPANMPNINFSAPVIRLGTTGAKSDMVGGTGERERGGTGRRAGLGMGSGGDRVDRDRNAQIQPQTKEEIVRTVFVGGITEGCGGDEGVQRILRAAGGLRRWFRAMDADDKPCTFGFAEYEDPESLRTAIEVLKDIEVPVKRVEPAEGSSEQQTDVEKSKLLVVADENSATYIEQWESTHETQTVDHKEMLIDQAKEALRSVLEDLENSSDATQKEGVSGLDQDGDTPMQDGQMIDTTTGEVVTIPLAGTADDDLSDIPVEMRETVAKEIASFRDRSNRRDLERLKREEEIEQQEQGRMANGRVSRLTSPPVSAPSGPGGGSTETSSIPIGPRGAPSGPKSFGQQIPKDYQKGVAFVNGATITSSSAFEGEDTDASDSELENRRKAAKKTELEKQYLDQERRWLNRERSRTAAIEREKTRDTESSAKVEREKDAMANQLKNWDDDFEASRKLEEYYADRSMWIRNRAAFRQREMASDDADRAAEQRDRAREFQQRERAGAMADDFLSRQEDDMARRASAREEEDSGRGQPAAPREPARFKMNLGGAAQQRAAATAQANPKRTVADVEGLLEDEEENDTTTKRTLIPIQYDASSSVAQMSDEERAAAAKQLAADIPNDKEGLWEWDVKWDYIDESVIDERLKPFVEKKIVEYLGVQEQMLVEVVVTALRDHGRPQELVDMLEEALEEEAEVLVKKLWRMVIFFSESEKRGLSA